jgi:beta-fructofuranosidase
MSQRLVSTLPSTRDRHRPSYHFLPPANWMNDPNGFIQWGSTYHLFYQYNPAAAVHDSIHWGHAASEDLVHWRHLPIALTPTPGGPDADGCWSGSAVDDDGTPTIIYTGASGQHQRACLATGSDDLVTWQKYPGNPIIPEPPSNLELVAYRDHCVWREADTWYQVMGAGIAGVGGAALLYRSSDLRQWDYVHPLSVANQHHVDGLWTGAMWECPDFFPLSDRHVLVMSVWDAHHLYYAAALVGDYRDHRFEPLFAQKLDYGDRHFYAPQSLADRTGRRVVIGWVQEGRSIEAQRAASWSGTMSLPRELALGADGRLRIRPVTELESLRGGRARVGPTDIRAAQPLVLEEVSGDALELEVLVQPAPGGRFGVAVRCAPDDLEQTLVVYDAAIAQLTIDRSRASLDPDTGSAAHTAPLALAEGEPLRLRIFLDRSILEVFANDTVNITTRIYPTRSDSLGVALFAERGDARLLRLDAWHMHSIWGPEG